MNCKPITGYKNCLICNKAFPYRETLKIRGDSKRGIAWVGAKYCYKECNKKALIERNKSWVMPMKFRKLAGERGKKWFSGPRSEEERYARKVRNLGEKSHFWKGGVTEKNKIIRVSLEYRLWREAVFKRDYFTCVECKVRGGKLNAHHVKPFAFFPELRFAIDNGVTLCFECHKKTDSWGRPKLKTIIKITP